MKKILLNFSVLFSHFVFLSQAFSIEVTLYQCFDSALKRSESMAIQLEAIEQAEERYRQANGGLFPTINGIASYSRLDTPSTPSTVFTRPDRPEVRLTATQPIFRGFREFAVIRQRKLQNEAEVELRHQATLSLYGDVSQNFYSILTIEQDLRNLAAQIDLNQKRVSELNARRRIGRSRPSEVLAVETAVAHLEAQSAVLQGQLSTARETFSFLTGLDRASLLRDHPQRASKLMPLDHYTSRIDERPDLKVLRRRVDASTAGIQFARGGHLPSVDVSGNYYLKRVGVLENQKWDVTATLTLPIFSGGVVQSQLREAISINQQIEQEFSRARRLADQEIRSFYQLIIANQQQVTALEKATDLAEKNYTTQSQEYRLGLVTNLDVLQALNLFQENRRSLGRATLATKLDLIRLEAAIGQKEDGQE